MRPREISQGVTLFPVRTPTLPPATRTNSYALGARQVLLVEPSTPYEDEQRAWIDWARALPSTGREPVAIFATHYHGDHIGGLDVLSRELGLPVWTHAETAKRVGEGLIARRLVDGEAVALDGPEPARWQVLETPGHAWGHLCLFHEPSRTLVAGDMVAGEGTILIARGDGDMRLYLASLARLLSLDARLVLPAHGDPIDDPAALFSRYIAHRALREAKVKAALSDEPRAVEAILPQAYDDTPAALWPFARLSLETHLDKLVADGAAREDGGRFARAAGLAS